MTWLKVLREAGSVGFERLFDHLPMERRYRGGRRVEAEECSRDRGDGDAEARAARPPWPAMKAGGDRGNGPRTAPIVRPNC